MSEQARHEMVDCHSRCATHTCKDATVDVEPIYHVSEIIFSLKYISQRYTRSRQGAGTLQAHMAGEQLENVILCLKCPVDVSQSFRSDVRSTGP